MNEHICAIQALLEPLMTNGASLEEVLVVVPEIMQRYDTDANNLDMHFNRLRWGLTTYYELNHA